jgi:hypothetical protein
MIRVNKSRAFVLTFKPIDTATGWVYVNCCMGNAHETFKASLELMDARARARAILLYEMYLEYGEKGLEVAEDLLEQTPTESEDFDEEKFKLGVSYAMNDD